MSPKTPVGYIDVRVFAHATEDPEKVLVAVRNLLPEELGNDLVFKKTRLTGHHGNPIIFFEAKLVDKHTLPDVLRKIGLGLTSLDKEHLEGELLLHLEKRDLYLRFDKQFAFRGKVKFSRDDPVRFKVHFKNKSHYEIIEFCRDVGLLP